MRKTPILVLLAAILAACTGQSPSPTDSATTTSQTPQTSWTPDRTIMQTDVKQLLDASAPFQPATQFTLAEPFDVAKPLHRFGGGSDALGNGEWPNMWQAYLTSVGNAYPTVLDHPRVIGVVLVKTLDEAPCDPASLQGKDPKRPFVCTKAKKGLDGTKQDYVLVMPAIVSGLLAGVAAQSGAKAAWEIATVAVALVYAQYLRQLYQMSIGWPNGAFMDYCVAGISARAVFPLGTMSFDVMTALDNLYEVPKDTTHITRTMAFKRGYDTGQLARCTEPY